MSTKYLTSILVVSLLLNAYFIAVLSRQTADVPPEAEEIQDTPAAEVAFTTGEQYPFIRVVDGDTVIVGIGGTSEYVRLIGIDSPEPNDPGGPECYADDATKHLKALARTGTIVLVGDDTQGERDKYSRLLAYVELPDGTDLGEAMIRDGYAREFTYDRPYERRTKYLETERAAAQVESGLWSPDACAE